MWRNSLARNVLWQIVELSHTTATCFRALVMATFILLLSPRNPTAPRLLDRTYTKAATNYMNLLSTWQNKIKRYAMLQKVIVYHWYDHCISLPSLKAVNGCDLNSISNWKIIQPFSEKLHLSNIWGLNGYSHWTNPYNHLEFIRISSLNMRESPNYGLFLLIYN